MIILDTNIISELVKSKPDQRVFDWLDGLGNQTLYLTAITVAELRFGIHAMPVGKRCREFDDPQLGQPA